MNEQLLKIKKQILKQTEHLNKLERMINEYERDCQLIKKETTLNDLCGEEVMMRVVNLSGIPIIKGRKCYLCCVSSDGYPTVTTVKHHGVKIVGNAIDHIGCSPFDNKGYLMVKGTLRGCDSVEVDIREST